jgi:hypothetical protein
MIGFLFWQYEENQLHGANIVPMRQTFGNQFPRIKK